MTRPVYTAVADDDTGATDLAGMLAEQGLRTVMIVDIPDEDQLAGWSRGYDAVVIGTGARALSPADAYQRTRQACRLLRALEPKLIQIKYCSTFDSTAQGNIGPSLDAALDELNLDFTVALPALPVNGRTTYMGHHFVFRRLLSDSPMRNHPLTPMTNPNLVSHLQSQTQRRVGLAEHPVTPEKLAQLRREGVEIAILDCVSDADLQSVCEAIDGLPLISGSSAPAIRLPAIWRRRGAWSPAAVAADPPAAASAGSGFLVVAGSCSEATRAQNRWLEEHGGDCLRLDGIELARTAGFGDAVHRVETALRAGRTCLLATASTPEDIVRVQQWAAEQGRSANEIGLDIAYGLARLVLQILEQVQPAGLIIAGGETSGALCRTLELGALEVGRNIDPGVPLCYSLGRFQLPVALKSGNFGSVDFYGRARAACTAA